MKYSGDTWLGFRAFYHYRLLKKSNRNRIEKRLVKFRQMLVQGQKTPESIRLSLAGWEGYAMMGNTY